MADWSRANGSSGASSSSSARDLISPLAMKLQQVWLETQLRSSRDSNAAVDVPLPSPVGAPGSISGVGHFSPSPTLTSPVNAATVGAAATPSSSSESGDDSWGCVATESRPNLASHENPVLQYINSMLMEDHIEQQPCLDLEVSVGAFQAELAELIQNSPPEVSPNFEWGNDGAGCGGSQPSPSQVPHSSQASSSRRNSPSSLLGSWTPQYALDGSSSNLASTSSLHHHQEKNKETNLQRSPSLKKRSHQETSGYSGGGFHMVSQVGFFERQNFFGLDWSGKNGRAATTIQEFSSRPPRLILQRNESYTRLWDRMGLKSHLMDKLVLCGEAVSSGDFKSACEIMLELRDQAAGPEGDATQRIVYYFIYALSARMDNTGPMLYGVMCKKRPSIAETLKAVQMILTHTPFLGLPHFFTNQIILEAIKGERKVHIVDFGIMYGLQWPALLQLLAERKEGPPQLRITGVDLPPRALNNHAGRIRETGGRLKRCALDWGIPFKFKSLSCAWESMEPATLQLKDDEVLIINCSFKQTNLFDDSVIAQSPKLQWLTRIRNLNPKVFIQSLASSDFAGPIFLKRFQEALIHHAAAFAAMDACISRMLPERRVIEQDKYGREIMNIIACEGLDRVERSETHQQWHHRAVKAGLAVMPLSPALFEESKAFARRYNKDLTVNREGEWMSLGWRDQIIHAYSAWRAAT